MVKGIAKQQKKESTIVQIKTEYLFLIIGLIFGLQFVFTNPPWQTNDEDRHFIHSYFLSQGYILPKQGQDKIGGVVPVNIYEIPARFQGIRFSETVKISKAKLEEAEKIPLNENNKQFFHNQHYNINPVGFIPSAFGIFIGQTINDNPVWLNWWGRIGDLIFYLVIIFFAIKIIPIFKNVIFLYALTPMSIYQGSSVTYDAVNISLTFLIFAVIIKFALDEKSFIGWKEFLLIMLLIIIHRFSKDGYPLIPLSMILIPIEKYKLSLKPILVYLIIFVSAFIIFKLPDWTWKQIINLQHYKLETPKTLKKDLVGSFPMNLELTLQNPGKFFKDMFLNLNHFRQEWAGGTIGRFGYSYTLLPDWFFLLHGLILIIVAYLESGKKYILKTWQKSASLLIAFGSIFGIIIMSYFYSPVGASQIFGLQGRYFINAIPFLLLVLYNNNLEIKEWKKYGSIVLSIYIILSLIYTLLYINNVFYTEP